MTRCGRPSQSQPGVGGRLCGAVGRVGTPLGLTIFIRESFRATDGWQLASGARLQMRREYFACFRDRLTDKTALSSAFAVFSCASVRARRGRHTALTRGFDRFPSAHRREIRPAAASPVRAGSANSGAPPAVRLRLALPPAGCQEDEVSSPSIHAAAEAADRDGRRES